MSSTSHRRLAQLTQNHDRAVREFVEKARAIGSERWLTPRAEGKWTPAQEVTHLILTYEAFVRQLTHGETIRLRGTPLKRMVWRAVGMTSILWFRKIPAAVNAPREVRPDPVDTPAAELIPRLEERVATFENAFARAWRHDPQRRLMHPLFGYVSLDQGIRFLTVHTRHHAAFLPVTPLPIAKTS